MTLDEGVKGILCAILNYSTAAMLIVAFWIYFQARPASLLTAEVDEATTTKVSRTRGTQPSHSVRSSV